MSYLRDRKGMEDFDFFSFEWYPFDNVCADPAAPLAQNPGLLADLLKRQEEAGLPPEIPKVIIEYGYSSFVGQVELELPGAMVNAETAAMFLAMGGQSSYSYGLEPNWVFQDKVGEKCDTWGNLMLFQFYDHWEIRPLAAFQAARLVNQRWLEPGSGRHNMYNASSDVLNAKGQSLVTAYAPSGRPSWCTAVQQGPESDHHRAPDADRRGKGPSPSRGPRTRPVLRGTVPMEFEPSGPQ